MSILYFDGLDWPTASADAKARWTDVGAALSVNTTGSNYSTPCLTLSGSASSQQSQIGSFTSGAKRMIQFWYKLTQHGTAANTDFDIWAPLNGGTAACHIKYNPSNDQLKLFSSTTQVGTTDTGSNLKDGNWHWVEWLLDLTSGTGSSKVKIDNTERTNLTVSSQTFNQTAMTAFEFFSIHTSGTVFTDASWDDWVLSDTTSGNITTFTGKLRIRTCRPSSDSSIQWTPDTGVTNYTQVNKSQWSNTHYVFDGTVGHQDFYGHDALANVGGGVPQTIYGVMTKALGELKSGTSVNAAALLKSSSTTDVGTAAAWTTVTTTPVRADGNVRETDPNGNISWTAANINSTTIGTKVTALTGSGVAKSDMVWLEVLGSETQANINYTFTLDVGTFTVTGKAMTRSISAALGTGVFTVTGEPTTRVVGKVFGLGTGVFTMTGQPMTKQMVIGLGKGTFTLTGYASSMSRLFKIDAGIFRVTGFETVLDLHIKPAPFVHGVSPLEIARQQSSMLDNFGNPPSLAIGRTRQSSLNNAGTSGGLTKTRVKDSGLT